MIIVLVVIVAIIIAALISAVDCAMNISVTDYNVCMESLYSPMKLVCISDLHGWQYGKKNCKLIALISEQSPDAIIIAGDMITRRATDKQIARVTELINSLTDIAPVFYATGNHEADYMAENGMDLLERISETGAVVLYDRFSESPIGENTVRIGAASGRYFDGSERDRVTLQMLEEIGRGKVPSIAVVHQPENLLYNDERHKWSANLFLSGHTHGGVWRVPFACGVMAPTQGLFPKYDKGYFLVDNKIHLIINAGLSGYYFVPRVFNRPEVCVITLVGRKQNG